MLKKNTKKNYKAKKKAYGKGGCPFPEVTQLVRNIAWFQAQAFLYVLRAEKAETLYLQVLGGNLQT